MLTWAVLGLHAKPIGLLNVEHYFDPLLSLLNHAVAEGFVDPHSRAHPRFRRSRSHARPLYLAQAADFARPDVDRYEPDVMGTKTPARPRITGTRPRMARFINADTPWPQREMASKTGQ